MDGLYVYSESGEGRGGHGAVWEVGQGAAGGDEEVRKAGVGVGARRQEDSLRRGEYFRPSTCLDFPSLNSDFVCQVL